MKLESHKEYKTISGPSFFSFIKHFQLHPVFQLQRIMKDYNYDDIVRCSSFLYLINSPDIARLILNRDQKKFNQDDFVGKRTKTVFGKGLVTSQGEMWRNERKLLNPIFNSHGVHSFMKETICEIDKVIDRWDSFAKNKVVFDWVDEMGSLAIMVTGKVLFDCNFESNVKEIKEVVNGGTSYIVNGLPFFIPYWIPTFSHLKLRKINKRIDTIFNPIIDERLKKLNDRNDLSGALTSMLKKSNNSKQKRRLVLDEMKTMLSGAYFPVASCLSMIWYILGKNPEYITKLNVEIRNTPKGYIFTEHFYKDFPFTTSVVYESMRLFPVAFSIWRKSKVSQEIDMYKIPKGKTVCISLFNIHRNPKFWKDPEIFDPSRFQGENLNNRPKHHFMPFGWGNRKCIGDYYALMVVFLTLIRVFKKFDIDIIPNQKLIIKKAPLISPKKVYGKVSLVGE